MHFKNPRLDQLLDAAIQLITGDSSAQARGGQRQLSHDVGGTMLRSSRLAGEAPTGSGKGVAYLAPAMLNAVTHAQRTLISTESLALQSQLVDKDAPVVAEAVAAVTGAPAPTVAVLKGWGNYVCSLATVATAGELTSRASKSIAVLSKEVAETIPDAGPTDVADSPTDQLARVVQWSLAQVTEANSGDRATYDGVMSHEDWQAVSTTPAECPGVTACPFGETCLPAAAKAAAAEADIVVTNHSMLAVQAAIGVPVVIGNPTLGGFHHLVVDEAHALASSVRQQGAVSINAFRINDALRVVERLQTRPATTRKLREDAMNIATNLDQIFTGVLQASSHKEKEVKVEPGSGVFDGFEVVIAKWVNDARRLVPKPADTKVLKEMVARYRALGRLSGLSSDVSEAAGDNDSVARWVESGTAKPLGTKSSSGWTGATLKLAPIDVGGMLRANLYTRQEAAATGIPAPEDAEGIITMSVSMVSATLPNGFTVDLGLDCAKTEYPSPFDAAYDASLLFVPRGSVADLAAPGGGKPRFDTGRHPAWAAPQICDLVGANDGSALVLSATTAAGHLYAEKIRAAHPHLTVHSQWDGPPIRRLIAEWREDHGSVLVGTKTLMTGVDAVGGTCSLVIVDRVPRARGNPVDDARVEQITKRSEIERWSADRMVYGADAALLLEQAAGRLIRSPSDSGMVAVLDPRLLKVGEFCQPAQTRKLYLSALGRFTHRTSSSEKALGFLVAQKRSQAA